MGWRWCCAAFPAEGMSKAEATVRSHPLASIVSDERRHGSGIWVILAHGYCSGELPCATGDCVHAVHEDTFAKVARRLREAHRCTCTDCRK
jgi:hypothetical protein